jgi:hypothetical protein
MCEQFSDAVYYYNTVVYVYSHVSAADVLVAYVAIIVWDEDSNGAHLVMDLDDCGSLIRMDIGTLIRVGDATELVARGSRLNLYIFLLLFFHANRNYYNGQIGNNIREENQSNYSVVIPVHHTTCVQMIFII